MKLSPEERKERKREYNKRYRQNRTEELREKRKEYCFIFSSLDETDTKLCSNLLGSNLFVPRWTWWEWRTDFLTSIFRISLISSKVRVFIPFLMSLNNCSVKVIREVDTNNLSPFLTFFRDIWNCFLPPKVEMRSWGIHPRKWKYRWEPYFRGTNGYVSYEPSNRVWLNCDCLVWLNWDFYCWWFNTGYVFTWNEGQIT